MRDGPNGTASFFAELAIRSRRSIMGANAGFLSQRRGVEFDDDYLTNAKRLARAHGGTVEQEALAGLVAEALEAMDGSTDIPFFSRDDIMSIVQIVCEN